MRTPRVFQDDRDIIEMVSGADLSALEDTFVNTNAAGKVVGAAAGEVALGVLRNAPGAADLKALVQVRGIATVNAEEALSVLDILKVGAAGGALIATTTTHPVATAIEDSLISTPVQVHLGAVTVTV